MGRAAVNPWLDFHEIPDREMIIDSYRFGDFDPDALTGINAVLGTGASLTTVQKGAANGLVRRMKTDGLWALMDGVYLILGGTAGAHSVNWKQPGTYDVSWYGTVAHDSSGFTPDGATGAGIMSGLGGGGSDFSAGVYTGVVATPGNRIDMGGVDGSSNFFIIRSRASDVFDYLLGNTGTGGGPSSTNVPGLRTICCNGTVIQYENGTALGTGRTLSGDCPADLRFGQTGFADWSDSNMRFGFRGSYLDATQNMKLRLAVQAYQTALGRAV